VKLAGIPMANSTEFSPLTPRDLIVAIGPTFAPGDRLKAFLCIIGKRAGLHPRVVHAAWAGEYASRRTTKKLQEAAAANATRQQALDLAAQLETISVALRAVDASRAGTAGDVFDEAASHLRRAAVALRDVARP
jgi:hypothetical protein